MPTAADSRSSKVDGASILASQDLLSADDYALTPSAKAFDDGGKYRLEVSGVERFSTLEALLDEADKQDVFIHRIIAFGGGTTLLSTGNGHARRLLVEAAWHHRVPYRPGVELRRRWDAASPAARARGQAANRRLHARWVRFDERKKRSVVANAGIARELAGWCWSLAVLQD